MSCQLRAAVGYGRIDVRRGDWSPGQSIACDRPTPRWSTEIRSRCSSSGRELVAESPRGTGCGVGEAGPPSVTRMASLAGQSPCAEISSESGSSCRSVGSVQRNLPRQQSRSGFCRRESGRPNPGSRLARALPAGRPCAAPPAPPPPGTRDARAPERRIARGTRRRRGEQQGQQNCDKDSNSRGQRPLTRSTF